MSLCLTNMIFQKIFKMSKIINNDSFLKSQIVQIHINNNGYFELIPRIGNLQTYVLLKGIKNPLSSM